MFGPGDRRLQKQVPKAARPREGRDILPAGTEGEGWRGRPDAGAEEEGRRLPAAAARQGGGQHSIAVLIGC